MQPNRLSCLPPVPGTAYWRCPNRSCRTPAGQPSRWPLRVRKANGLTSRTASCPRCSTHRPLSRDEQLRITGDPDRGWPTVIPLAYNLVGKFLQNHPYVDADEARGIASEALIHAAGTFDPANRFKFSTHVTYHVWGLLRSRRDQAARRRHGMATYSQSEVEALSYNGDLFEKLTAVEDHAEQLAHAREVADLVRTDHRLTWAERHVLTLR